MVPLPVVVCGRTPTIAKTVRKGLLPEYDVIHICLSVEEGVRDIPLLLSNKTPPESSVNIGSQNYAKAPVAVATGAGFDDDMLSRMQEACKVTKPVPWFRPDMSRMRDGPPPHDFEAFGKNTAARVKNAFDQAGVGKEGGKTDGVYLF